MVFHGSRLFFHGFSPNCTRPKCILAWQSSLGPSNDNADDCNADNGGDDNNDGDEVDYDDGYYNDDVDYQTQVR